ncbi:MAG: preprotein translocase, YajC subunit [Oscillospiraceae bacterium]|jgi:preprotein translocase subunit YajC|nr:preprotein translocase, YajC subunit [Oscillospiraceae bacterium]
MGNFMLQATNPMGSYIMMGAMLVVVYLVMFLPQRKQQKKDAQMRASLDIGDEILTQGGIIGRVVSVKDDTIVIETGSDRVKIRILRSAVVANTTPKE